MNVKLFVLWAVALLNRAYSDQEDGGPHNIVGHLGRTVTLDCHREVHGGVRWSHIPPGGKHEQPMQALQGRPRYRNYGSSYGKNSLHLEDLQRSDAGSYVCRSTEVPQSFSPASAFVVVMPDDPVCSRSDMENTSITVSCLVVYNGMLNLTMSLIRSHDNRTVASDSYTSQPAGSWRKLNVQVPTNSTDPRAKDFICRAEFYSTRTSTDVAKNRPDSIQVSCTASSAPGKYESADEKRRDDDSTTRESTKHDTPAIATNTGRSNNTTAIDIVILVTVLVILFLILTIVVIYILAKLFIKRRPNQQQRLPSVSSSCEPAGRISDKGTPIPVPLLERSKSDQTSVVCNAKDRSASYKCVSYDDNIETPASSVDLPQQPSNDISASTSMTSMHSLSLHSEPMSVDSAAHRQADVQSSSADEETGDDSDSEPEDYQKTLVNKDERNRLARSAAALNSSPLPVAQSVTEMSDVMTNYRPP